MIAAKQFAPATSTTNQKSNMVHVDSRAYASNTNVYVVLERGGQDSQLNIRMSVSDAIRLRAQLDNAILFATPQPHEQQ